MGSFTPMHQVVRNMIGAMAGDTMSPPAPRHGYETFGFDPGLAGFVAPLLLTEIQPERTMDQMYHVGNKICDCGSF